MNDAEAISAGVEIRVEAAELRRCRQGRSTVTTSSAARSPTRRGGRIGRVASVDGPMERCWLVVDSGRGEILIPLAAEICVRVDPRALQIVNPPEGLIELNERGFGSKA